MKNAIVGATENDTLCSDRADGMPGGWFKTKATMEMAEGRPNPVETMASAMKVKKELDVPIHKRWISGLKEKDT